MRAWREAFGAGAALLIVAGLASAAGSVNVEMVEGQLSIHASRAPVDDVLAEVTKVSGVEFATGGGLPLGTIDADLGPGDPEQVIRALVMKIPGVSGTAASYRRRGGHAELSRLSLFASGRAPSAMPAAAEPQNPVEARSAPPPIVAPTPGAEVRRASLIAAGLTEPMADEFIALSGSVMKLDEPPAQTPEARASEIRRLQARYSALMGKLAKLPPGTDLPESLPPLPID